MKIPRPFALPHLVRNFDSDPRVISKKLIESAKRIPPFNYLKVDAIVQDFMKGNFSLTQLRSGLVNSAPEKWQHIFSELADPLQQAFSNVRPKFIVPVQRQALAIPGGVTVPFNPGFVYANEGEEKLIIPHRLYWRTAAFRESQLTLFFSLAKELLVEDDNVADAELQLLTMSANTSGRRVLRIHKDRDFSLLGSKKLNDALETYRTGYELACEEAHRLPEKHPEPKQEKTNNLDLFN